MFLISSLGPGGAERVTSILANEFIELGDTVALSTFASSSGDFFPVSGNVVRYELGGREETRSIARAIFWNLYRIRQIYRVVKEFRPQFLVSFLPETNVLAVLGTLLHPCRVIVCERNRRDRNTLPFSWRALRKITYPLASAITANSIEMKEVLESSIKKPVVFLENPVELPAETSVPRETEKMILSVGRLNEQKNFDLLIRSFSGSKYQKSGWDLIIVGEGVKRQSLQKLSEDLLVSKQVNLVGLSQSVTGYFQKAALFVLTSRFEGTPNAALEAMAMGVPVLVTETSGEMKNIVRDGLNGIVALASESHVRDKLDWASENQQGLEQLGREGRISIQRFEKKVVVKKWKQLLLKIKSMDND